MKTVTIKFTKEEVDQMGLLTCKSCGYPENNHWEFAPRTCAHTRECTGWKPEARYGKIVKRRKK